LLGRVEVNGRPETFERQMGPEHHHLKVEVALRDGKNTVRIRVQRDFGLAYDFRLPQLGSRSEDLRILSDTMPDMAAPRELQVQGRAGTTYQLTVWNPELIDSVQGAELVKDAAGIAKLRIQFPYAAEREYTQQHVAIHLHSPKLPKGAKLKE
jgi:hypothetical protein